MVSTSAFTQIEEQFQILANGLRPLAVDGTQLGHGLPAREIPLDELRERLLDSAASTDLKQAVWTELTRRAQKDGPEWTVGAVGMMLPGLQGIARRLIHKPGDVIEADDLDSEMLLGFLEALSSVDPDHPAVASRLWWSAYGRGAAARRTAVANARELPSTPGLADMDSRPAETGSPDLVLAHAVTAQVITAREANLIGATRIEHESLQHAAARLGIRYEACRLRRWRAEQQLTAHIGRDNRHPQQRSTLVAA